MNLLKLFRSTIPSRLVVFENWREECEFHSSLITLKVSLMMKSNKKVTRLFHVVRSTSKHPEYQNPKTARSNGFTPTGTTETLDQYETLSSFSSKITQVKSIRWLQRNSQNSVEIFWIPESNTTMNQTRTLSRNMSVRSISLFLREFENNLKTRQETCRKLRSVIFWFESWSYPIAM